MAEGFFGCAGGIFSLLDLIEQHQEALEYELIREGLRLRDLPSEAFNWRDLFVLIRRWQKTPGNAFAAALNGGAEVPAWGEQVLALVYDALQAVAFILKHGKGQRPKRLTRWWEKRKEQKFGSAPIPLAQFADWWSGARRT